VQIEEFTLERIQSLFENTVRYNLSDSGVHPYALGELLSEQERADLAKVELGYGWTNGGVALRERIASLYPGRTADEIIVTNGSAEANFLIGATLIEPGDEIVVIVPNYLQLFGWARAIGANVKTVALREELGWRPDLDEVAAAVTSKTKMLSLCVPNNPTGALLTAEDRKGLVAIARKHDLWLHADEVYKGAELHDDEPESFADMYEKALVVNGLSKAMAMPGLRLGWLVGPAPQIAEAWLRKDYTSITTGALSEHIAELVLQPQRRATILARSKAMLREHHGLLMAWIGQNERFTLTPPKAGGMAFVRYDLPIGSTDLAHQLREKDSVLLLPGDVYGMDGYVRIGIGAPKPVLEAGLAKLSARAAAILDAANG
jgi:aspartate/methionine/tyrosine aminotransferase